MMPKGWKKIKFGSFAEFRNGLNFLKSSEGEAIKIVGVSDFKSLTTLSSLTYLKTINVQNKVKSQDLLADGDLLYVRSNGNKSLIGRCLFFPKVNEKVSFSGFTIRGRVVNNVITPEYMAILSRSELVRAQFSRNGGGTNISNLSQKVLTEIVSPLPPLLEQKQIAKILSTWDNAISIAEQLFSNSKEQKKALMQQLLTGKKRLLDNSGVKFSKEWQIKQLGNLFKRVTTKNNRDSENVVTISAQQGLVRQKDYFKKNVASDVLDGYFLLKQGQFAYNKSYSNGYPMGAIKRLNKYSKGVVTTLYICFEVADHEESDSDFFEQYFESGLMIKGLTQIAHEGGRAHGLLNVKPSDFFCLKLVVPLLEEQKKIAKALSAADVETGGFQKRIDCLIQEKKFLMQQLLTGKRRVKFNQEKST